MNINLYHLIFAAGAHVSNTVMCGWTFGSLCVYLLMCICWMLVLLGIIYSKVISANRAMVISYSLVYVDKIDKLNLNGCLTKVKGTSVLGSLTERKFLL